MLLIAVSAVCFQKCVSPLYLQDCVNSPQRVTETSILSTDFDSIEPSRWSLSVLLGAS